MNSLEHALARIACVLGVIALASVSSQANTVTVPGDFPTLQAVMDSLYKQGGAGIDSVIVQPGVVTDSLTAYLSGLAVIGIGDSTTRPVIKRMLCSSDSYTTFTNFRFSGPITTCCMANLIFEGCEIAGSLISGIDGDPRSIALHNCYVTGPVVGDLDIDISVTDCVFDGGSVALTQQGTLRVHGSTFRNSPATAVSAPGDVYFDCSGNRFEHCAVGVEAGEGYYMSIATNRFDGCGTGIMLGGYGASAHDNVVMNSLGSGIVCRNIHGNLAHNVVGRSGGSGFVAIIDDPWAGVDLTLDGNTSFMNQGDGFAIDVTPGYYSNSVALTHDIGFANHGHGMRSTGSACPQLSCNDWFANDSTAVAGCDPAASDLAVNPEFCDPAQDDVHLAATSPLLDAPGCGLIGALSAGCGATASVGPPAAAISGLRSISPNPAMGATRIAFDLARDGRIQLEVLDVQGRSVATLASGVWKAGRHVVNWSTGRPAPGVYFIRFRAPDGSSMRRVVRIS